MSLYETDFYTWTQVQAKLLRARKLDQADIDNIIDEIETLGRSEARSLKSAYRLATMHLLKMLFQPERASNGWRGTIIRERSNIRDILKDSPGLNPRRDTLFAEAYADARRQAAGETGLPLKLFPALPPFTLEQVESDDFWPETSS